MLGKSWKPQRAAKDSGVCFKENRDPFTDVKCYKLAL